MNVRDLFNERLAVVNIGVKLFADALRKQGVKTIQVEWKPPAGGDNSLARILNNVQSLSEEANQKVLNRIISAEPVWIGIRPAIKVVPGMQENTILHSGPPIEWERMCMIQGRAILGGILHEGLADTKEEAARLVQDGKIDLKPANDLRVSGAGVGIVTASMMVNVVKNILTGAEGYCCPFEGRIDLGTWGVYNEKIEDKLKLIQNFVGPTVDNILKDCGGIGLKSKMAQGILMNDELHTRQVAAGLILFNEIIPLLVKADLERDLLIKCVDFLRTERFFHSLEMAFAISVLNDIRNVEYSSIVTTMVGNGVDFGIKVSALGEKWFTAPSPLIYGKYLSTKWRPEDANPWLGDSSVMETIGLGGFAAAASPTVVQLRGGSLEDAIQQSEEMRAICIGTNDNFPIPNLGFIGPPVCIDIRKVVEIGVTPICHGGIISKEGGQIGAGSARVPLECFKMAIQSYIKKYNL
jgi:hypothetical protein